MKVRTVNVFAFFMTLATSCFVDIWMVLEFFPTMTCLAKQSITTAVYVVADLALFVPLFANFFLVFVLMRLSSVVLPVVRKYANITFMRFLVIRTPNRFEMKHVEVVVTVESID